MGYGVTHSDYAVHTSAPAVMQDPCSEPSTRAAMMQQKPRKQQIFAPSPASTYCAGRRGKSSGKKTRVLPFYTSLMENLLAGPAALSVMQALSLRTNPNQDLPITKLLEALHGDLLPCLDEQPLSLCQRPCPARTW